jgi:hypothetical protein
MGSRIKHSFYTRVDGNTVHVTAQRKISNKTQEAIIELVRAALKKFNKKEVSNG